MAMETSPEHPAPVRQITQAIGQWIDRLGAVWVEGQVTQISRRGGMNTVFLTLRDKLADISVQVTCNRGVIDSLPTPLVEGAQIVCHAKPSFYPNRGTLSLNVREIRLVGEGELLARLERRRQLLAAEGLFAEELKRPLPFLPRNVGLVTAQNSAAERDVLEQRPAALAGRPLHREVRRDAGHARRPRGDRGDPVPRPRPRRRRDRGRARRRLGRGPAAVLRRGAWSAPCTRSRTPARLRDRPRAGLPHPRPRRRRTRLDTHRRGQAGGARRRRGGPAGAAGAGARTDGDPRAVDRELHQLDGALSRPSLADPRTGLDERLAEVDGLRRARAAYLPPPARPRRGRPRPPGRPDPRPLTAGDAAPRLRRALRRRGTGAVQRGHARARPGHPHPGGRRPHRRHHDHGRPDRPDERPRRRDDDTEDGDG